MGLLENIEGVEAVLGRRFIPVEDSKTPRLQDSNPEVLQIKTPVLSA